MKFTDNEPVLGHADWKWYRSENTTSPANPWAFTTGVASHAAGTGSITENISCYTRCYPTLTYIAVLNITSITGAINLKLGDNGTISADITTAGYHRIPLVAGLNTSPHETEGSYFFISCENTTAVVLNSAWLDIYVTDANASINDPELDVCNKIPAACRIDPQPGASLRGLSRSVESEDSLMFSSEIESLFSAHALSEYPREACGLIVDNELQLVANVHDNSIFHFELEWGSYATLSTYGKIQAVLHSHTNGRDYPSKHDMEQQMAMAVPWGIVNVHHWGCDKMFWFGDQVPIPPLTSRSFRHGVTDCYALVRDWFRLNRDITLKNYARDNEWWNEKQNVVMDHWEDIGFRKIEKIEEVGDCVIARVLSDVPNHCGVHIGDGEMIHHLSDRPSRVEQIGLWRKYIVAYMRYEG